MLAFLLVILAFGAFFVLVAQKKKKVKLDDSVRDLCSPQTKVQKKHFRSKFLTPAKMNRTEIKCIRSFFFPLSLLTFFF